MMKKLLLLALFGPLLVWGQPTVLYTSLSNTTPSPNNSRHTLNAMSGVFKQVRFQANQNITGGNAYWAFHLGSPSSPNYSSVWRPYTGNNTLSSNTYTPTTFDNGAKYNSNGGGSDGKLPAITSGNYYTFNVTSNTGNNVMQLLETSYNPVTLTAVNATNGTSGSKVITITTSATPHSEEYIYLRYTTNSYSSSTLVQATGSGTTWTATIPWQTSTVSYYVYSSNKTLTQINEDVTTYNSQTPHDMSTLNLNNNSGTNYAYTPIKGAISGTTTICSGSSTPLQVLITSGTSPYTLVYSDGTADFTINNYVSATNFNVFPLTSTSYSIVSITDASGSVGSGTTETAVISVTNVSTPTISAATSTTLCPGETVQLTASGSGHQWYKDGNLITGATASSYSANAPGAYTVISTVNSCSSLASAPTAVVVNALTVITQQPTTTTQNGYTGATLSVTASGTITSYQWNAVSTATNTGGTPIAGATNATYNVSGLTANTYYYCKISGPCGVIFSDVSGLVTGVPSTAISNSQCGQTIATTNTVVNCTWVGAGIYRFVVSGGNLGSAVTVDKTWNGFQFADVTGALPGTYSVAVSFKPSGQTTFGAATTCSSLTLGTSIPTTAIVSTQCGTTIASTNTTVNCTWVGPGTYRFVVSGGNLGAAVTVDKTWNGFQFGDVTGALPGTYSVAVSFKPTGYASFGTATTCNSLTLGTSIPTTAIASAQCGTIIASTNTTVNCTWVGPGTYRFVVSGSNLSSAVTVDKTWNGFQFNNVTGALPGAYSVAVSFKPTGYASFGTATTCSSLTLGTSIPTTAVLSAQCGTTIESTNTTVNCTWVGPGTYRFVVSGGNLSSAVTVDKTWNGFQFNNVTGALPGTYSVAVSFKPNGQAAFGNATTCNSITLGTSIPTTAIASAQCGTTIANTNTTVNCTWVGPGTYRFVVSGGNLSSAVTVDKTWNGFQFNNVTGALPGTYSVAVSFMPNGQAAFGNATTCNSITLGTSIPTTAISSAQCGTTIASTNTTVNCTWVGPGTYRFILSGGNLSAAVTVDKTWNGFQFNNVTGALPGTYSVAVSFMPNGQAAFGNATTCNSITLGESIPTTAIATTQCANGVTSTSTVVNCAWVGPGTYRFVVSGGTLSTPVTLDKTWNGFQFSNIPSASFGGYTVSVSFRPTGYTTFGDPMTCEGFELTNSGSLAQQDPQAHVEVTEGIQTEEITNANEASAGVTEITAQSSIQNTTWTATATSNPFEHSFKVNLNGAEAIESAAMFTATLTDMSGKVYTTQTLSKEALTEEYFGQDLAPGMYMLTLRQGEELRVLRVVKR